MEITVFAPWCGSRTTFQIESDDMPVFNLKLKMQQVHGILIADQDLYYGGTLLQNFEPLKYHGIQDGAELDVRLTYRLTVYGPNPNEAYRLLVHKDLTLGQVKEILTDKYDVQMRNTTFIFGANSSLFEKLVLGWKPPKTCRLEDDDATLEELGIRAETYVKFIPCGEEGESVNHIMIRCRFAMEVWSSIRAWLKMDCWMDNCRLFMAEARVWFKMLIFAFKMLIFAIFWPLWRRIYGMNFEEFLPFFPL